MDRIYLDAAATTPLLPEVAEAMQPWLNQNYGNPSSLYAEGRVARNAIDQAREVLSEALECAFGEVHFTSSGTEACNLALLGLAAHDQGGPRNRVLVSATEHHAMLHCHDWLVRLGYVVTEIPARSDGQVELDHLASAMGEDVLCLALMHANNELGTIQPVLEASAMCNAVGARMIVDAVQTFGSLPVSLHGLNADMLCLSAHKVHGPKGIGVLALKAGVKLAPMQVGGGQERELRAGTENVAGIVGFGEATNAFAKSPKRDAHRRLARDAFVSKLTQELPQVQWSVPSDTPCLSGHAHCRIPGCSAESMLVRLDRVGVCASSGAACSSGSVQPSHVLLACGWSQEEAKEGLRFTCGWHTSEKEAQTAAIRVAEVAHAILKTG